MKTVVKEDQEFKPFTLELTIETQREAQLLFCIAKSASNDIADLANKYRSHTIKAFSNVDINNVFGENLYEALKQKS